MHGALPVEDQFCLNQCDTPFCKTVNRSASAVDGSPIFIPLKSSPMSVQLSLGQSAAAVREAEVLNSAGHGKMPSSSSLGATNGLSTRKRKKEDDDVSFVVHRPWDLVLGPEHDVLTHSAVLDSLLSGVSMVHFGPNCATFSRAREFPIPGVKFPPKPLRSREFPEGLPDIPSRERERVTNDTATAKLAARKSLEAHARGRKFSLEHPGNSIAKELEEWKELMSTPGVFVGYGHACMFHPCKRRKYQMLISNDREVVNETSLVCASEGRCSRTGLPHDDFRPSVKNGKVVTFKTAEEREYPVGWCEAYARGLARSAQDGTLSSFVEIFSGPRAPLTVEVAKAFRSKLPAFGKEIKDLKTERFSSPAHPLPESLLGKEVVLGDAFKQQRELTKKARQEVLRNVSLETGRQTKWQQSGQLVPDGINDPVVHSELASKLSFPQYEGSSIHKDVLDSCSAVKALGQSLNEYRLRKLRDLESKGAELAAAKTLAYSKVHPFVAKLGCKLHVPLMKHLQDLLSIEDVAVPDLCLLGFPIVGTALESPFFEPYPEEACMSLEELLRTAPARRQVIEQLTAQAGRRASVETSNEVVRKLNKEISEGTMSEGLTAGEVTARHGKFWNCVRSFGLVQGCSEDGKPKVRRIDDHSEGCNNASASRRQKVIMTTANHAALLSKAVVDSACWQLSKGMVMYSEDMQGAYRQIPLLPSHVSLAITAVWHPERNQVLFHEMYGNPFGAAHAVPNFCRFAEWVCRFLRLSLIHI